MSLTSTVIAVANVVASVLVLTWIFRTSRRRELLAVALAGGFVVVAAIDIALGVLGSPSGFGLLAVLLVDVLLVALVATYAVRSRRERMRERAARIEAERAAAQMERELEWQREERALALRDRCVGFR